MDWKLEAVIVPVSDVDRAKAFYVASLGFAEDVDHSAGDAFRIVQVTPPGSGCSIVFGTGLGAGEPGAVQGTTLVVPDIEAALAHLETNGVANSGIVHYVDGKQQPGPHPERINFGSLLHFADPDGNTWTVQERPHA